MELLIIVLCLLSERFLIHSISCHRFSWFINYSVHVKKLLSAHGVVDNPWILLTALILPIVIPLALILFLLHHLFFGLFNLIISLLVFFYCLGPQNVFYPVTDEHSGATNKTVVGTYLAQANSQLFAVIFWYVLAGPVALLAYRLLSLSSSVNEVMLQARKITAILEWVPARMTALLYLLVGNFQRGLNVLIQFLFSAPEANNQMLSECGLHAIQSNKLNEITLPVAEELVEHASIVLLVLIALFTLAAWM